MHVRAGCGAKLLAVSATVHASEGSGSQKPSQKPASFRELRTRLFLPIPGAQQGVSRIGTIESLGEGVFPVLFLGCRFEEVVLIRVRGLLLFDHSLLSGGVGF